MGLKVGRVARVSKCGEVYNFNLSCQYSSMGESGYDQRKIACIDHDKHLRALEKGRDFVDVNITMSEDTLIELGKRAEEAKSARSKINENA